MAAVVHSSAMARTARPKPAAKRGLHPDTLVRLAGGYLVEVSNIAKGAMLRSEGGKLTTVQKMAVHATDKYNMIRLSLDAGSHRPDQYIEVSAQQNIKAKTAESSDEVIITAASRVQVGDFVRAGAGYMKVMKKVITVVTTTLVEIWLSDNLPIEICELPSARLQAYGTTGIEEQDGEHMTHLEKQWEGVTPEMLKERYCKDRQLTTVHERRQVKKPQRECHEGRELNVTGN